MRPTIMMTTRTWTRVTSPAFSLPATPLPSQPFALSIPLDALHHSIPLDLSFHLGLTAFCDRAIPSDPSTSVELGRDFQGPLSRAQGAGKSPITALPMSWRLEEERAAAVEDQLAGDGDTAGRRPLDGGEGVSQRQHLVLAGPDRAGINRHLCIQAIRILGPFRRRDSSAKRLRDPTAGAACGDPTGASGVPDALHRADAVRKLGLVARPSEARP